MICVSCRCVGVCCVPSQTATASQKIHNNQGHKDPQCRPHNYETQKKTKLVMGGDSLAANVQGWTGRRAIRTARRRQCLKSERFEVWSGRGPTFFSSTSVPKLQITWVHVPVKILLRFIGDFLNWRRRWTIEPYGWDLGMWPNCCKMPRMNSLKFAQVSNMRRVTPTAFIIAETVFFFFQTSVDLTSGGQEIACTNLKTSMGFDRIEISKNTYWKQNPPVTMWTTCMRFSSMQQSEFASAIGCNAPITRCHSFGWLWQNCWRTNFWGKGAPRMAVPKIVCFIFVPHWPWEGGANSLKPSDRIIAYCLPSVDFSLFYSGSLQRSLQR